MAGKILCVDDDPNILEGYKRQLRKEFELVTAVGPEQGLRMVAEQGPFAVVVSDLQMPGMNGVEFLAQVRVHEPDTVRMLLTGNAELQAAIDAINQGQIFRFLTKPCTSELLGGALKAALAQHRLINAERELLEQTLSGSIGVLSEVLALVNPEAFGRSARITRYVESIAENLHVSELWSIKTAAMLSQIGCVILPESVLKKVYQGAALTAEETQLFNQHPFIAYDLIAKIPRMKRVAEIIKFQDSYYDGVGMSGGTQQGKTIPMEAGILKVALDFDALESSGKSKAEAFGVMQQRKGWYDPTVIDALKSAFAKEIKFEVKTTVVAELLEGMILAEDIQSSQYVLLASKGQQVTQSMILRLQSFRKSGGVREPFTVLLPIKLEDSPAGIPSQVVSQPVQMLKAS
ncbi:MAG: response regulator [Nitrospirae bacterium]|jgi:response regulator RpfG family c-di-GMP phosphodiesterase|nr:response regulator [Nitrospirota bacterium]